MDTIEAERAVHVARLPGLVQLELTAGNVLSATDAVLGPAGRAHFAVADPHFQRRGQRLHEVELADGAEVLAKGGPSAGQLWGLRQQYGL